uniref:DM2 domain-containing protein n=1 Tax=Spongospora subterranea TaxID=70186 RepID=A0A0H5RN26_9EUKA|eukprot:CRZ10144.1 hypothetical protein [Spongospora subterranea]
MTKEDIVLPENLEQFVPESKLFVALLRLEQRIDASITRFRLQTMEMSTTTQQIYRILRVFLSHQLEGDQLKFLIQGCLVDPDTGNPDLNSSYRFSNFIRRASVTADSSFFQGECDQAEWVRGPEEKAVDGFSIQLPIKASMPDTQLRVQLLLDDFPKRYTVPDRLAAILGLQQETSDRLITALWAYVRRNNLQDAEDPTSVIFDEPLADVFGCSQTSIENIRSSLLSLLAPADPVTFIYQLSLSGDPSQFRHVYEIALQIPDPSKSTQMGRLFCPDDERSADLDELTKRSAYLLNELSKHQRRYQIMMATAESPVDVARMLLANARRDMRIICPDKAPSKITDDCIKQYLSI